MDRESSIFGVDYWGGERVMGILIVLAVCTLIAIVGVKFIIDIINDLEGRKNVHSRRNR